MAALACAMADAHAEIYACEGEDGVTSYQDQPCPEPAASGTGPDPKPAAEPEPIAEPESPPRLREAPGQSAPADPELVAACKKRYRDEIDRIYAELQNGIRAEEQDAYRHRARAISQQLIRCEHAGADTTSGDGGPEPAGRDL